MTRNELVHLLCRANITRHTNECDILEVLQEAGYQRPRVNVATGASKICIWFDDFPGYVIKWSYDDAVSKEIHLYKEAKSIGLEFLLPATELLCEAHGTVFSLQEKVSFSCRDVPLLKRNKYDRITRTVGKDLPSRMNKEFHKAKNGRWARELDPTWAKMVCSLYGRTVCIALCNFVIRYGINDLHRSNIGYIKDRPVILDFCGYE